MAGSVLAVGWLALGGLSTGGTSDVSCGSIQGIAGIIVNWTHTKDTKWIKSENGECGAKWNGSKYELCPELLEAVSEDSECFHDYYRDTGGTTLTISLSTQMAASGSATIMDPTDTSWWWNPTVDIHDVEPTVTLLDTNGVKTSVGWAHITNAYDHISAHGTGGSLTPAASATLSASFQANTGGSTSGAFAANTGLIAVDPKYKDMRISYHVYTTANRTSDNASVAQWKVTLISTMETSVSP